MVYGFPSLPAIIRRFVDKSRNFAGAGIARSRKCSRYDNRTADAVRAQFESLPKKRLAKESREAAIRALAPLAGIPLAEAQRLGFHVERSLWASAQDYASRGPASKPSDKRGGRADHELAGRITEEWVGRSFEGAGGRRVFYKTQQEIAGEIADDVTKLFPGAAPVISTAVKYKPQEVRRAKRPTDLCPICEEIRRLQLRLAKRYGAAWEAADARDLEEARQREAAKLFAPLAAEAKKASDPDYAAVEVLRKHMDLANSLKEHCVEMVKFCPDEDKIIMVADWAGEITVKSHREDAYEYFNPQPLQMLGALVSIYNGSKERETKYLHACDPRPTVTKSAFRSATGIEQCVRIASEMHVERHKKPPKSVEIWMDAARRFRSKLITYHLLWGADVAETLEIGLRFFAERHGKSPLDATFRTARERVARYVDYSKVKAGELTMEQAIQGAYAKGGAACPPTGRYREMFLKHPVKCAFRYGRRKLKLPMPAASIREMDVVWAAGKAEIVVNANRGGATSIPIRWEAAPHSDDDESEMEPDENPRRTPQQKYTYLGRVEKKFQSF